MRRVEIEVIAVVDPAYGDGVFAFGPKFRRENSEAVQHHFERSARSGEANLKIGLGPSGTTEEKSP
jgi:hypothetical protein|tara:strand:- start:5 stop:202 length:198 start_codon:yes stop_codon:yes gene_type:complete